MPLSFSTERVLGMYLRSSIRMSSVRMKTMFGLPWTAGAGSTSVITNNSSADRLVAIATTDNLKAFAIFCVYPLSRAVGVSLCNEGNLSGRERILQPVHLQERSGEHGEELL